MKSPRTPSLWLGAVATLFATCAMAMNVIELSFDSEKDELVFTIAYRGTHPDHVFTVRWDPCRTRGDGTQEVLGIVHDSHPNDPARAEFQQTVRVRMSDLPCRPTVVTVGAPNPLYRRTITIPAKSN